MKIFFLSSLVVFINSCQVVHNITGTNRNRVAARSITMTNQQQTDSIVKYSGYFNTIFKGFVRPDKNFKVGADGGMALADTIYTNTILTKKKLTIGIDTAGIIKDTLIDSAPQKIVDRLTLQDLEDAIWVRKFYERMTDSLFRANDSLKAIINKR